MGTLQIISLVVLCLICPAVLFVSLAFIYLTVGAGFMHSSPSVPSYGKIKNAMLEEAEVMLKNTSGKIVVDLGSGWGTLLLPLARKFPEHKFVGIERGFLPFNVSLWRARKLKNLVFYRQDIFTSDISDADIIFVFLLNSAMAKLTSKLKSETKPGSVVIANRFPMKDKIPEKEVNFGSKYYTYYVYKN